MMKRKIFLATLCCAAALTLCGFDAKKITAAESISELDEKTAQVLDELENSYAFAWATTSFGDNSSCCFTDDKSYFQCLAGKTYAISEEGLIELWSDFKSSITTLSLISDSVPFEKISVKFSDPSGTSILDMVLVKGESFYSLDSIMVNIMYSNTVGSVLSNIGSEN